MGNWNSKLLGRNNSKQTAPADTSIIPQPQLEVKEEELFPPASPSNQPTTKTLDLDSCINRLLDARKSKPVKSWYLF